VLALGYGKGGSSLFLASFEGIIYRKIMRRIAALAAVYRFSVVVASRGIVNSPAPELTKCLKNK
jgi:hypothetical protein